MQQRTLSSQVISAYSAL